MIKYCKGCGIELQDNNVLLEGYTNNITNDYCRRCFKMNNYGEYEFVTKSNLEYIEILKKIGSTRALVVYVVDLLSIPNDILKIKEYLKNNKILLVLNKKDALDSSIDEKKILEYFNSVRDEFIDIVVVSASNKYNLEKMMKSIKTNRITQSVYVVGNTNAGKSTLINALIDKYTIMPSAITISLMPSTTLNEIKIPFKDFTLIDTPGLVDDGNILNYIDTKDIKKLNLKKEIKPRTYQLKQGQAIIIEDFFRIDYVEGEKNSFTVFMPNDLKIKRVNGKRHEYLKDLSSRDLNVGFREDIVINGLGFIKIIYSSNVKIYTNKDIEVFTRRSLI